MARRIRCNRDRYGAAWAVSSITAAENDARVLLLEMAPFGQEGGNSRYAGQVILSPDSGEKALAYFKGMNPDA
jgi:hypothetical protein